MLTAKDIKALRAILINILADKAMTPRVFTWDSIANSISMLTQEEKDFIARSVANSEADSVNRFIKGKLRYNVEQAVAAEVDVALASGSVTVEFLHKVLV